jgi:epoxyqueuosine reductase
MTLPTLPDHANLATRLKARAAELGFAFSGIAPATDADGFAHFEQWLERGFAGEMSYLSKLRAEHQHPRSIHETARSVMMLALEYTSATTPTTSASTGRVARYAQGRDYHRDIWDRLNALAAWLEAESPGCRTEAVADTAPLLERDFARRAGLGWIGKNTMLINTRRGSFFFLGALLTTLELPADSPSTGPHCGTCTACLDACPTQAFAEPFVLDARKCISYLTIELRSEIPVELRDGIGNWLYGCDVCQEVCPWNRKRDGEVTFPHDPNFAWLDPVELLALDADAFRARFRHTAFWRNRRSGLLRNAAIVLGNTGTALALPALEHAAHDPDPLIREAATWAIARIHERVSHPTDER